MLTLHSKHKLAAVAAVSSSAPHESDQKLSYDDLEEIAEFIRQRTSVKPTLGVICGSGLGGLAEHLDKFKPKDVISYKDIPKFPTCKGG